MQLLVLKSLKLTLYKLTLIYIITIKNYHLIKNTTKRPAPIISKVVELIPKDDKDDDNESVAV